MEDGDRAAGPAATDSDSRLPYEKPSVAWEQPLEAQPSLMSGCEKQGGASSVCNTEIASS